MDILRREIKKQIEYCIKFDRYKAGIFVSDTSKIGKINEILDEINKIVGKLYVIKSRKNELFVEFLNGSSMRVFVPSDNCRGCKFNGFLIDEDIAQDVKDCIIHPMIVQRLIEVDDGILEFEDTLETNKRIVEVEMQETSYDN